MCDPGKLTVINEMNTFKMVRLIAEGGMGAVYEAKQLGAEGFEKTVAIKTILESYSNNYEFVRMFIGEAKLVADLVHENIVQVYDLGKMDPIYYIAMEYVDGINLEQFLNLHKDNDEPVPLTMGAFITSRVCRGLEYAHNKRGCDGELLGIVHRDVSPKNIMLNTEGVVKLTDFGIAKARMLMEQEEGEVLMGKVEYMSPEQARYLETDQRSDLFSLGVVMYELLTGYHIFDADDIYETLNNVKRGAIPDPRDFRKDIPEDLAKIILKAMDRDLTKRYQTASEVGYDLEYHLYHKGYGPTNQTLGGYLRENCLPKPGEKQKRSGTDTAVSGSIRHRADTLFGDLLDSGDTQVDSPEESGSDPTLS